MKNISFLLLSITLFLLSSCNVSGINLGYAGTNRDGNMSYTYLLFNSSAKHTVKLSAGDTLHLDIEAKVSEGNLVFKVLNSENEVIWSLETDEDVNQQAEVSVDDSGLYNLIVQGDQTRGNFKFKWKN